MNTCPTCGSDDLAKDGSCFNCENDPRPLIIGKSTPIKVRPEQSERKVVGKVTLQGRRLCELIQLAMEFTEESKRLWNPERTGIETIVVKEIGLSIGCHDKRDDEMTNVCEPKADQFMECPMCSRKTGTAVLCASCVHNRTLIERLKAELKEATRELAKKSAAPSYIPAYMPPEGLPVNETLDICITEYETWRDQEPERGMSEKDAFLCSAAGSGAAANILCRLFQLAMKPPAERPDPSNYMKRFQEGGGRDS